MIKRKIPVMSNLTSTRKVFFYELIATVRKDFNLSKKYDSIFQQLLSQVVEIVRAKDAIRYQYLNERALFIDEITFIPTPNKKIVRGKLLSVRKDFFPELMNTSTDKTRAIEAFEEEGIVETTHFILQESNKNKSNKIKVCIEHNQFGAKIYDLMYYLSQLGTHLGITTSIDYVTITRNSLKTFKARIGEISKIIIKIKSDNIKDINSVDTGLASAFQKIKDEFKQEYVTMEIKYDYYEAKNKPTIESAQKSRSIVSNLIDHLLGNKNNTDKFERLEVIAQDEEKNNRLKAFDLLIDKAKDEFPVARREKSKTIVSSDIFDKMSDSLTRNRI